MNIVSIQFQDDKQPKYLQLFEHIKQSITAGELKPGEKLPTVRSLSQALDINSITVLNAYKQLENNKYVTAKKGSGYYVSNMKGQKESILSSGELGMTTGKDVINFASAAPHPSIFPTESFKECINEVLERDRGFAFGYQESSGFKPLRSSILGYIGEKYGIKAGNEENVLIVSGAQQGIDLIGKVLLNPGDYVIMENPTYDGAAAVFKSRGARVVGVSVEEDGADITELEKKIRICRPKLIYLMTSYQNPTTVSYSAEKLEQVLVLAKKYEVCIVEDDSMSELNFGNRHPITLKRLDIDNSYVIYLKSFSKILMPGLRAGCMIIPGQLTKEFTKIKHNSDLASSGLIQRALDMYFRTGKWEEHLQYMKEIYRGKYEFMLTQLERMEKYGVKYEKPGGGLYFWITLPKGLSAMEMYHECREEGLVLIPSGVFFELDHKNKDRSLRLSFASSNIEEIRHGMDILEKCLDRRV
ncbi:2-aminoadipate transaminase [Ruminiclostridium hungatei]|uniref:2-aminoadipate transaminase n=1 Tax=Ruminiclostridium hungatei TaxID=48256 RepID=A0A1V4SDT1_RUMHU|nr:PLP-dependent aminotransferase family protein [Ruminiclostridium hungatei]OPX42010.1 2-aminoadipate transaminase [Ruminiclostridium hungatei]